MPKTRRLLNLKWAAFDVKSFKCPVVLRSMLVVLASSLVSLTATSVTQTRFAAASTSHAADSCRFALSDRKFEVFTPTVLVDLLLAEVYRDLYKNDPEVCIAFKCQFNVAALLSKLESRIPNLKRQDFKFLLIGPSKGIDVVTLNVAQMFHPIQARRSYKDRIHTRFQPWRYHFVLLYKDVVLDPDFYHEPRVLKMPEYFRRMFADDSLIQEFDGQLHGPISELSVWEIPAEGFRPNDVHWYSRSLPAIPMSQLIE